MKIAVISFQNNTDIIGAKYIHAYLRIHNYDSYLILQPHTDQSTDEALCKFIQKHQIHIIGISLMSYEFYRACHFIKRFKEKTTDVFIVFGGIHASIAPEECLTVADVVVRGEGEHVFLNLIELLKGNKDFSQLPGICMKEGDRVLQNPMEILEKNLDSFPFPKHMPENMFVVHDKKVTPIDSNLFRNYSRYSGIFPSITTTRGCSFSCTYCCNSAYKKLYKTFLVRKRSVESVISECLEIIGQHPYVEAINIQDDCFLANETMWVREFSQQYKNEVKLPFFLRTTPKQLTEEKLLELKKAGLAWIFMGLQSGSDRVNKEIFNRNVSSPEFLKAAGLVSDAGICAYYDVICDNPYETDKDMLETINVALSIQKPFQLQLFSLTFYQGTDLAHRAIKDNINYQNPRKKHQEVLTPTLHNKLVRMIPTYPPALIRYLSKHRNSRIIRVFINICNMVNTAILEPLSLVRLMHLSFGSKIIRTIKILYCYKRRAATKSSNQACSF
jgi:radical SAM superfamily enzyme YgiQ (UPF0313 family)